MSKKKPAKTGKTQEIQRNEKGQFLPGVSGNPDGPKAGYKHLSTALHEALQETAQGQAENYQALLIKRVLNDAIVKGKGDMVKLIFAYIDGQALQGIDLTSGGDKIGSASEEEVMAMAAEISARLKEQET